jgi:hypothetical protein
MTKTTVKPEDPKFAELLKQCISEPGIISAAYSAFHQYSFGNMIAAAWQLAYRGQKLGPIASFNGWKDKGRSVKKGAKAISLCLPVAWKINEEQKDGSTKEVVLQRFIWKRNWFVLQDTEGAEFVHEAKTPEWNAEKALTELNISVEDFAHYNGNVQGYAYASVIALNPLGEFPHKTRFHEMAHILLGHTKEGSKLIDDENTPRDIREVEAESVAYLCCALLNLPGLQESRGYVRSWLGSADIPEKSVQKIFKTVDMILKAGAPVVEKAENHE